MRTIQRMVVSCGVMVGFVLGGCAPSVGSGDASSDAMARLVGDAPIVDTAPAPGQCVQGYLGDSSTCHALSNDPKDPFAGIQPQVDAACAQMGLVVSQWSYDGTVCPAQSGSMTYLCCPSPAPGTDPSGCSLDRIGGGYCMDEAELLLSASEVCAKHGRELGDVTPVAGSGCPAGQAGWAQYACCDPAAP